MRWLLFLIIAPLFALVDRAPEEGFLRRLGKLPLILFWLAIEYIAHTAILGNAFSQDTEWVRWAKYTGYSGVSLWILLANLFLYFGLFRKWPYTLVFVIVIVGPILYSYSLRSEPVIGAPDEWVARTAAWISVLVLLSAVVKGLIRRK